MKIAITGGTGFIGGHLARTLVADGHEVVLIARGVDKRDLEIRELPGSTFVAAGLDSIEQLTAAFTGCDAVAHCAGINRERGGQTYERVHVLGSANVVAAAHKAGIKKIVLMSFLRARPNCGSGYHESKFSAEEIFRNSALDYTVIKEGITYGLGDHMISHLSWALRKLPVFAFVGFREKMIRPIYVDETVRILVASLTEGRLQRETVAVVGPEEMPLSEAVNRVSQVLKKRPLLMMRLPVFAHKLLAILWEKTMMIPLASRAQVMMLSEGLAKPAPETPWVPDDLAPRLKLTSDLIARSIPKD